MVTIAKKNVVKMKYNETMYGRYQVLTQDLAHLVNGCCYFVILVLALLRELLCELHEGKNISVSRGAQSYR